MVCIRGKQWKGLGAALGVSRLRNRQGKGKLRSYFYYYRVQIVPIFFMIGSVQNAQNMQSLICGYFFCQRQMILSKNKKNTEKNLMRQYQLKIQWKLLTVFVEERI